MKNTTLKKQFSNLLLGGLLCIILTSCENFIDGGNIKQKLENDITYAKAEQFYIKVGLLKNEHGQITPSNEELYRVSDKINIEFTLSSSYTFNRFRIIDKDSKIEDTSQAVTLSEVTESTNGLIKTYKTTASVNFIKQNLMILPDCYLTTDTVAPQFYSNDTTPALKIARNKSDIDNGIYIDNQELTDTSLNWLWSEEECQARHVSSLYIKASIKEEDSSTVTICVKENFFADAIGSDGSLTFGQIEPSRTETVELTKIGNSNEGIFEYEGEYKFRTDSFYKKLSDGLFRLEFTVKDSAGNESQTPVCFYVIKDTFVDVSKITLKNAYPNYNDPDFSQDSLDQYKTFFVDYSEAVEDSWAFYTTAAEDFTYRLIWGPDEDSLKSTTDAFNPQVYENCFGAVISDIDETVFNIVRLEVTDKAGAVGTIEKLLPPRPELINVEKDNYGSLTLTFFSPSFDTIDFSKNLSCTLIEYQSEESCYANLGSFLSIYVNSGSIPYLDKDFAFLELDGLCGPALKNITIPSFSESSDLTVPSFKVEVNSIGLGSGLYRVELKETKNNTSFFENISSDEITYRVCVFQETAEKLFFKEDSFVLNYSAEPYYLKVIAEKNGEIAESDIYKITETQTDNKAPQIRDNEDNYRSLTFNNKNIKQIPISCIADDNNFSDTVNCTILYSDYNPNWKGTLEIFDQAQVLSLPSFNISLIPDSNTVYSIPVPVKNLKEDGNYLITIVIHDKFFYNELTQTIGIAHVETVLPPVITKFSPNGSEKLVTCKLQDSSEMERQNTYELLVYYWENNEWTLAGNLYTHNEINSSTRTGSQVLYTEKMPAFVKTFLYAYSEYEEGSSTGTSYNGEYYTSSKRKNEAFSAPVYKLFSESEIECFSKAIIETSSKTVILNDKPAFVHLVSACADYGSDVTKWERFGDFYDETVIKPDVTGQVLNTYEPDLSKIPQGDYYTIIAWFADGTSDISSVHKK